MIQNDLFTLGQISRVLWKSMSRESMNRSSRRLKDLLIGFLPSSRPSKSSFSREAPRRARFYTSRGQLPDELSGEWSHYLKPRR